ncbi:MAG: hypothetical protein DRP75_04470 [Candidatus Omnitrophota bacterium]|nr:MAG: hypothetical protein DRP75_04470 [Candidatus Omnitrophota bacterium]
MEDKGLFLERVEKILMEMNMALKSFQLYPPGHPALGNIGEKVGGLLQELIRERDLNISIIGGDLVANGIPFLKKSGVIESFKQEMERRRIEGISFLKGLERREVEEFISCFSSSDWQKHWQEREVKHIKIGKIFSTQERSGIKDEEVVSEQERVLHKVYQDNVHRSKEIIEKIEDTGRLEAEEVNSTVEAILRSLLKDRFAFLNLSSIKDYDNYTFTHCVDTCILSLVQGEALGFSRDKLLELGVAAFLHDMGKILVPKHILNKPSRLTPEEELIMREHPINGAKLLRETKGITPFAAIVAFEHHIHYNLSGGYPKLRQKRRLNLFTMVVSIADVYDALTTLRPYRRPLLPFQAIEAILKLAGTQFDPFLVQNFVHLLGPYPVGSFVRLSTNELAVVCRLNPGRAPWVKIIFDSEGRRLEQPFLVDLSAQTERKIAGYDNPLFKGVSTEEIIE